MAVSPRMKWKENGGENPLAVNAALWESALTEFSSHSFRDASLNGIIRVAGMNKGSFYYRFHDKLDLYLSLLDRMGMEKPALSRQYDSENAAGGFWDEFRKKAVLELRCARKEPRSHALWRRVMVEEPSVRSAISACFGDLKNDRMAEMIEKAKTAGELRSDLSARMAALVLSTLMDRLTLLVSPDLSEDAILAGIDELITILRYGIASGDSTAGRTAP